MTGPDIKLWLRADSAVVTTNGLVTSWNDVSENDNHFTQSTISQQPSVSNSPYLANKPAINFVDDYLKNSLIDSINSQNLSIFIVSSGLSQGGNVAGLFCVSNLTNGLYLVRKMSGGRFMAYKYPAYLDSGNGTYPSSGYLPNITSFKRELGVESRLYLNGVFKSSDSSNSMNSQFTNGEVKIGQANGYSYFKGSIAEIIVFKRFLSDLEQAEVEQYLMDKYAPPVNLGEDLSIDYGFCDTSLTSPNFYTSYLWSTGSTDSSIVVDNPGLYWLETIDVFDRVSRDSIIVNMPLRDSLILDNEISCFNEPTAIDAFIPQGNYQFESWSDANTNPLRILTQNETLSYTVSDTLGCSWTSNTANMSVDNSLEVISLGIDTSICVGNSLSLEQTPSSITQYQWSTGNTNPLQIVDTSGTYILNVINDNECQNSDTIEVTIIGDAPDLFYSLPFEICQGSELNFTENSTVPPGNTISEVIWDFGDLDSSFNSNGSHIYVDSGSFNASLQVLTLEGCSSQDEFTITVHPKPIISFTTENYCPYEEIEFSASTEYDIPLFFYNWEFGQNASSSTDIYPSYSYGINGNYDVQLIAVDTNNCIDTVIQNVFIQPAPVAEISIFDPCELAPLEIIDNSSIADTFSIVTYSWNYGDNTDAINPNEDKIYESYGQYNVQLTLEADNGCVDTLEQLITVHPKPILAYDIGPACKNTWTSLENNSTIPEGSLDETNWLINLQYGFNQQNTEFKFPTLGIQLVNLESISDQGCVSDTTFEIDVQNEISADFMVNPMNLTSGTPLQFINESLGADSSFWDFGDGNGLQFNQNQINEITYDQSLNGSNIDVALIISNELGCRDTSKYTYDIKEAFLDLALQTLFVQDINGYLTVGVELSNLGSVMLENADLYLKSAENGSIMENWTGQLTQNHSEIYIFNAHPPSYSSTQDDTERYICIEGGVNNSEYVDVDVSNNIICKNIEGNGLVVLPIYPNPTEDDITVSILLTESSPLRVELVDQSGRLIVNQDFMENLNSGIHKIVFPFSNLQKGIYHLRVSNNRTTLIEKIVRY